MNLLPSSLSLTLSAKLPLSNGSMMPFVALAIQSSTKDELPKYWLAETILFKRPFKLNGCRGIPSNTTDNSTGIFCNCPRALPSFPSTARNVKQDAHLKVSSMAFTLPRLVVLCIHSKKRTRLSACSTVLRTSPHSCHDHHHHHHCWWWWCSQYRCRCCRCRCCRCREQDVRAFGSD